MNIRHLFRRFSSLPTSFVLAPFPNRRNFSFLSESLIIANSDEPADTLFEIFKDNDTGLLSMDTFLAEIERSGLRRSDPRLREMMTNLEMLTQCENGHHEVVLDQQTFRSIISQNLPIIKRAFRQEFVIPEFQSFRKDVEAIFERCKQNTSGKVASYIPQLEKMSSSYWGVSVCTIDGQRFSLGDFDIPLTLQSCSKPLTYGIALEQLGAKVVHSYVGQEPSGRNFNEVILDYNKQPHNPMVNAGAILVCAMLTTLVNPEMPISDKLQFTMNYIKRLAGGADITFNNAVFLSERATADRNYALGYYMREHKCYPEDTKFHTSMDYYFQCCSIEATCETVAVIAATLANGGICPLTEEKVLSPESVRDVLSLMLSCGMYDYSGQFAFKVGLPAKSGVCGGMLVVIPNVMGFCTWSPPLDALGNSCRGIQFCEELVKRFDFHLYDHLALTGSKVDPRRRRFENMGLHLINLLFSAANGHTTALRRHKLSGMDMSMCDYDGRTSLHLAAAGGKLEAVRFLIEKCNVSADVKDRWGNTPQKEAATFGHEHVVQFINDKRTQRKTIFNSPTSETD